MMPHQQRKQRPWGVGDTSSSGGNKSSGTTLMAMTGNKDNNVGHASHCWQQWLLAQCRQSRQWLQLLGWQRSWWQAWTGVGSCSGSSWSVTVMVVAAGVMTAVVDNNQHGCVNNGRDDGGGSRGSTGSRSGSCSSGGGWSVAVVVAAAGVTTVGADNNKTKQQRVQQNGRCGGSGSRGSTGSRSCGYGSSGGWSVAVVVAAEGVTRTGKDNNQQKSAAGACYVIGSTLVLI